MGDYLVMYEGGSGDWTKRSAKEIQAAMAAP